ncbi:5-(carboxyamino)imidazole ribonucleotide synthase [Halobacteriales archaeon SW_7_71_33]|nr:MAG: 5-(carboxyamino)imidazole ribonucleotide synthase [Halobacteriales archaeon SW_7_71_33]
MTASDTGRSAAATLGVVGGGQLGRMLAEAAAPLGVEVVVLDPTPRCPASTVARDQVVAEFDDPDGVRELAERVDALTLEIELAGPDALRAAADAAGVPVHPDPGTLGLVRDKLVQKRRLREAGVPVPEFRRVDDEDDLRAALDELGTPAMLKARTGGYDGRGNVPVESRAAAGEALATVGGPAMVEEHVDFDRELSVMAVRSAAGVHTFDPAENVHREEILRESVVPARTTPEARERADTVAGETLAALDGRGAFGVELFEVDGRVLVNEVAPRPHNSGHWTIEGARVSQFEAHVRAVLGWPLPAGATERRGPTATANLLGAVETERPVAPVVGGDDAVTPEADGATVDLRPALDSPASLHWYGKRRLRPLRKMGHVTATGDDPLATARRVRDELGFR